VAARVANAASAIVVLDMAGMLVIRIGPARLLAPRLPGAWRRHQAGLPSVRSSFFLTRWMLPRKAYSSSV